MDPCEYCRKHGDCPKPPLPGKAGRQGCVVCCNGVPYPCSFHDPKQVGGDEPRKGINDCIITHEQTHIQAVLLAGICNPCKKYDPCVGVRGADFEECKAYNVEIICLRKGMANCDGPKVKDPSKCKDAYWIAICSACLNAEDFCPKAKGIWDKAFCAEAYEQCRRILREGGPL